MLTIPSLIREQIFLVATAIAGGIAVMQPHTKEETQLQARRP